MKTNLKLYVHRNARYSAVYKSQEMGISYMLKYWWVNNDMVKTHKSYENRKSCICTDRKAGCQAKKNSSEE